MARLMRDILANRRIAGFVGREEELSLLLGFLENDAPVVIHLHGIAGIGKSSLMEGYAAQARSMGVPMIRLDCREIEPSEQGFLRELGSSIGASTISSEEAAERLSTLGNRVKRLQALPFVESASDGLVIHDAVQQAIATSFKAAEPEQFRDYRIAAWKYLRSALFKAVDDDVWRYTADLLYLIGQPIVREAFFPSNLRSCNCT